MTAKYYEHKDGIVYLLHGTYDGMEPLKKADGERRYIEQNKQKLRTMVPPGTKVYTLITHVSASGMQRRIRTLVVYGGEMRDITHSTAVVTGRKEATKGLYGVICNGCGMDMGFDLVYALSRALYPEGTAEGRDGGYVLRHEHL